MNKWESLKRQFKDVFKKTEPVVEKEKEEDVVVQVPVRIAGVYEFEVTKDEVEVSYGISGQTYKETEYSIVMKVKAIAQFVVNEEKIRVTIDDKVGIVTRHRNEESLYRGFIQNTKLRNELIEMGMKKLVIKQFNEDKLKSNKEAFEKLGKIEFDIKIEIREDNLKK